MKRGIAFVGSGLTVALLTWGAASHAEQVRLSPAACEKVDWLYSRVNGALKTSNGMATFEASDTGTKKPEVRLAKNDAVGMAAFTCPVPDTGSHPAFALEGVNVHLTDRSTAGNARAFAVTKLWFGPGYRSQFLGETSVKGTCTRDPFCTIQGKLALEDDGNFQSVVVALPGKPSGGQASEFNGLFFF